MSFSLVCCQKAPTHWSKHLTWRVPHIQLNPMFVYLKTGCVVFKHCGRVVLKTEDLLELDQNKLIFKIWKEHLLQGWVPPGRWIIQPAKVQPFWPRISVTWEKFRGFHMNPPLDNSPWQKRAAAPFSHTACPRPPRSCSGCPQPPWWGWSVTRAGSLWRGTTASNIREEARRSRRVRTETKDPLDAHHPCALYPGVSTPARSRVPGSHRLMMMMKDAGALLSLLTTPSSFPRVTPTRVRVKLKWRWHRSLHFRVNKRLKQINARETINSEMHIKCDNFIV